MNNDFNPARIRSLLKSRLLQSSFERLFLMYICLGVFLLAVIRFINPETLPLSSGSVWALSMAILSMAFAKLCLINQYPARRVRQLQLVAAGLVIGSLVNSFLM